MNVYTHSEARQRLSSVVDEAERRGSVRIRRRDGREFEPVPVERAASPFDLEGAGPDLSASEIVAAVHESRARRRGTAVRLSARAGRR